MVVVMVDVTDLEAFGDVAERWSETLQWADWWSQWSMGWWTPQWRRWW
jgi:hypothetical protein